MFEDLYYKTLNHKCIFPLYHQCIELLNMRYYLNRKNLKHTHKITKISIGGKIIEICNLCD